MFTRIIVGLVFIGLGVVLIIYTEKFLEFFGRIAWAEEHLGSEGGTRIFYKLIGFAFIILAFGIMSGKLFSLLTWIFPARNG